MSQVICEIRGKMPENFIDITIKSGPYKNCVCRVRDKECEFRDCLYVQWISDMDLFEKGKPFQYHGCLHAITPGCPKEAECEK